MNFLKHFILLGFLVHGCVATHAQLSPSDAQYASKDNLLTNPSFEQGKIGWTLGVGSWQTSVTGSGVRHLNRFAEITLAGQGLDFSQTFTNLPQGLVGNVAYAKVAVKTTVAGVQLCGLVDAVEVNCKPIDNSGSYKEYKVRIPALGGTSNGVKLKSDINLTGVIEVDDAVMYATKIQFENKAELLADGSFENGIDEWSCTNATVEQVAGGVSGDFQTQIDFTADGGFCELVSAVSGDTANQEYLPRAYIKTSNATVKLEFLDGTRLVAEPEVLTDGSFQSYAAQVIPSTSIITRVTGNNTDQAFVDAAGHTLGGFNRAASKNCSGVLDCENKPSGLYDASTAEVILETPESFVTDVARSGTNNYNKIFTVASGVFTETPNCLATGAGVTTTGTEITSTKVDYRKSSSSPTSLFFSTRDSTEDKADFDFTFECIKTPADYKTTEEKGVVTIPDNGDALVKIREPGGQSIGTTDTVVTFSAANVSDSKFFTFDDGANSFEVMKSGEYKLLFIPVVTNNTNDTVTEAFVDIDTGAGYSKRALCGSVRMVTSNAAVSPVVCVDSFTLGKGDKVRFLLNSSVSGTEINGLTTTVLQLTPLGGRQNIGEFATHRLLGEERKTPDTIGGEPIYEYCNEVATDITTSATVLAPLQVGLRPIEAINYNTATWSLETFSAGSDRSSIVYNADTGDISASISGTYKVGAGTVYCMRYRKP